MFTTDQLLRDALLIAIFLGIAFTVHEFAHALVAYRLGDGTAKMFGRLTLNPIVHFDMFGGLMLVLTALSGSLLLGWAKPTPVNPANLRDRRNGEVLVAVAGPASNLIMAAAAAAIFRVLVDVLQLNLPDQVYLVLGYFVAFNVGLAVFNMLPVPPLDGSALLFRLVSPQTAWRLRPVLTQYGFVILIVGILFFRQPLGFVVFGLANLLLGHGMFG